MEQLKEDNAVYVLQKAIRQYRIKVSNTSIREYLLSHPDYPSMKSICDALKKWDVNHYALKQDINEIKELGMPFIAHLNVSGGLFVFVEKIKVDNISYLSEKGKTTTESLGNFEKKYSGALVVMENDNESGEKDFTKKRQNEILYKLLLPLCIVAVALLVIYTAYSNSQIINQVPTYLLLGLILTKTIGLTASIFLVLHEFKVHSALSDKLCGFSSKTDCDTVLSSNASRIFGWLNWADSGLIYFTGTLIFLLESFTNPSLWILSLVATLALPYPVFSIYYQSVRLKKFCPFCLIVQLVFVVEFILLFPILKTPALTLTPVLGLAAILLLITATWLVFKAYYDRNQQYQRYFSMYKSFKRDPDIFLYQLKNNGYEEFTENENGLILGNPNAPVTVTAFLSLYCNPCASAFKKLRQVINDNPEIKINAIFSVYPDADTQKLINTLYYIYENEGNKKALNFISTWYETPKSLQKQLYENVDIPEEYKVVEKIGEKNAELFKKYEIPGTPTIYLAGYKYPRQYDYDEIENYISNIKELIMEGMPVL